MLSRPQVQLLALLALSSVAQATWFDNRVNNRLRRQAGSTAPVDLSGAPAILSPSPSASVPLGGSGSVKGPTVSPTPEPTPSPTTVPSSSPPTISHPSTSPSNSSPPSSTPSSTSPSPSKGTTKQTTSAPSTSPKETAPPSPTPSPTVIVITSVRTVSGITLTSLSSTTSTLSASPTANPASLSSEQSSGGMSSKTRNTVVGVVVGIGGAILLGGLAIVAWRVWGRKKNEDESDDLMGGYGGRGGSSGHEKTGSAGATTPSNPFQATLEGYHQPSKLNASSNF